ncbi:D12 class N6 adenine-specific DNA methyltransferase [Eubacterium uniforme]|uniref:D12 class N6 adenine-specific DNA methyltransferase n=1 Tax=Eubacterium uniforme TaxID=39495 RepID=A0A1T4W5W7_9FIRM|nr:DNA adenine methylase [Eubacterium uniforme]SKA72587.1 D12 class N6 adenine-specific DNA methyltransferase [Eubacterium uniforme]
MAKNLLLSPMLKWVGGKRQLLSEIVPMIDKNSPMYVEPFIAGGSALGTGWKIRSALAELYERES